MFKNYIKIAWRNLLKKKVYSSINIIGLGIGMACCALIFMFVHDELSYDGYHTQKDRISESSMVNFLRKEVSRTWGLFGYGAMLPSAPL